MEGNGKDIKVNQGPQDFLIRNLIKRDSPTLAQLCQKELIEINELPHYFELQVRDLFTTIDNQNKFDKHQPLSTHFDILYQCWRATRGLDRHHTLNEFSTALNSFESFFAEYGQNSSSTIRGGFIKGIDTFVRRVVHPSRFLNFNFEDKNSTGAYLYQGTWVPLSTSYSEHLYVEQSIFDEVERTDFSAYSKKDFYHATGSSALDGIGKYRALLSSRQLLWKNEEVKTGEIIVRAEDRVHENILAEQGSPDYNYAFARWFDEFHCVFRVSYDRMRRYTREMKWPMPVWDVDGAKLGPEVPLRVVDSVYTEHIYLPQLAAWAARNCPHAAVVSFEALKLMRLGKFSIIAEPIHIAQNVNS